MPEIVIKIPKEFEEHFNSDRFEDSLQRVRVDIHKSIIGNKFVLSGNREIETLDMLTEAFLNGIPLPEHHGRLIDADAFIDFLKNISNGPCLDAITGTLSTSRDIRRAE